MDLKNLEEASEKTILIALVYEFENVKENVKEIREDIKDMKEKYVTKNEFNPVKIILYGLVGFILLAFMSGIATMVITNYVK